jgi:hypothetical protein
MRASHSAFSAFYKTRSKAHNPHLSALLTPSPFIKVEGKALLPPSVILSGNESEESQTNGFVFKILR